MGTIGAMAALLLCFSFLLEALAQSVQNGSSWSDLQISPKAVDYMPYRDYHLAIYESLNNQRFDSTSNQQKKYFCTPIVLLQPTSAHYEFVDVKRQHTVTFEVLMWNDNVRQAVFEYMNNKMNVAVSEYQIKPIPFDQLLLVCQTAADSCRCPKEWRPNLLHNAVHFSMVCPSKSEALSLSNTFKREPKQFRSVFRMMFSLAMRHSKEREVLISLRNIRNGRTMSKLEQKFPGNREVLLTADDANRLLSESASSIMVQVYSENDEVVNEHSEQNVLNTLQSLMVAGTQKVDADFKLWDSVFWNEENYRPDVLAHELNELKKNLDTDHQRRLVGAMSRANKNASEIAEILNSSASRQRETSSKVDYENEEGKKEEREGKTDVSLSSELSSERENKDGTSANVAAKLNVIGIFGGKMKVDVNKNSSTAEKNKSDERFALSELNADKNEGETRTKWGIDSAQLTSEFNSTQQQNNRRADSEESDSQNTETEEKKRALEESLAKIEWNGKKFVPKPMLLTRVNLANVRSEQTMKNRKISVSFSTAIFTLPVNVDLALDGKGYSNLYDALDGKMGDLKNRILEVALMLNKSSSDVKRTLSKSDQQLQKQVDQIKSDVMQLNSEVRANSSATNKHTENEITRLMNELLAKETYLKKFMYDEKESILKEISNVRLACDGNDRELQASLASIANKSEGDTALALSKNEQLEVKVDELKGDLTRIISDVKTNASSMNKDFESKVERLRHDLFEKETSLKRIIVEEMESLKREMSASISAAVKLYTASQPKIGPKVKSYFIGVDPVTLRVRKANWYEAGSFCRIMNMTLATIESVQENEAFKILISTIESRAKDVFFWMDGTKLGKTSHRREDFYWVSTLTPITGFHSWLSGQPDNYKKKEQCLNFRRAHWGIGWNDGNCVTPVYFVCQKYL